MTGPDPDEIPDAAAGFAPHPGLAFDATGAPFDPVYRDVFRNRAGAWSESEAVFVDGCRARERWRRAERFCVLELGFGLGVNFLATLAAWRADPARCRALHFVSVEAHPLSREDLARGLASLPDRGLADDIAALLAGWPPALPGLHRLSFAGGAVTLTLAFGDAARTVPRLVVAADAIYLDGFAPSRNPAMWTAALMRALARHARPEARLATWSAAGAVREALAAAGFAVERLPGVGGKRHRIVARWAPRWRSWPPPPEPPLPARRHAIVIGAGLAGAAVAEGFARRGFAVDLLDARHAPGGEGSLQPVIADHLHLSPDDNPLARLTRNALGWRKLDAALASRAPLGKLLVDADEREHAARAAMLERLGFPGSFVRQLARDEASDATGLDLPRGGLWLPGCDALDPSTLASAWLATPGVALRCGAAVATLEAANGNWVARDAAGRALGEAAVAILANAGDAARLAGMGSFAVRRVRGQSTLVERERIGALRAVLGGDAYAAPLGDAILVGASFDDGASLEPSAEVDAGNLGRLARMIGGDPRDWLVGARSGPVGHRYASTDRMPAIGALPDEPTALREAAALLRNDRLPLPRAPGLYGAFAFGSRGLLWATLAAVLLPALAEGDPLPLESDLLRAVDPGRFVRRMLRRRRSG